MGELCLAQDRFAQRNGPWRAKPKRWRFCAISPHIFRQKLWKWWPERLVVDCSKLWLMMCILDFFLSDVKKAWLMMPSILILSEGSSFNIFCRRSCALLQQTVSSQKPKAAVSSDTQSGAYKSLETFKLELIYIGIWQCKHHTNI